MARPVQTQPSSTDAAARDVNSARTRGTSASGESFTREEWVEVAREFLIKEGIAGVKIDRLAKRLGVSRGGFYWRFEGLTDLLDALLEDWRRTNSQTTLEAIRGSGDPIERFSRLLRVWIDEIGFNPAYDLAIRDWARVSPKAEAAVRACDLEFEADLASLFRDAGCDAAEATIRARIVFYHQIGYYALRVKQSRDERYEVAGLYLKILTGFADGEFRNHKLID